MTCEVDDGSGTSCAKSISKEECIVDIKLNYTFTNVGLSCAQIMSVKAEIGSLGTEVLSFDDIYSFSERQICAGEYWTIPDRRTSINLCKEQENPWDIVLDVDEFFGTTTNLTYNYEWREYLSNIPSSTLSAYPSAAPSKDTCRDCTLTGVVSGGKHVINALLSYCVNEILLIIHLSFVLILRTPYGHCSIATEALGKWKRNTFLSGSM